ncbi:MAG: Calvin cycle protein CP12 [Cyanobacteriota bacterium]|nr:Calvin cycle protein CP12 [Cyanobacteriota bacterium]
MTSNNKLDDMIEQERQQARTACDAQGATSPECAAAWDAVEELQAEAADQRQKKPKSSFEVYCDDNPDAAECRVYED